VVLVGDHAQLGCVCRCRPDEETSICWTCHITNSHWYRKATEHHLHASIRAASDPAFAEFQVDVRSKQPSQNKVDRVLGRCYLPEGQVQAHIDAVGANSLTIICTHKEDVDRYNTTMLHKQFKRKHIVQVPARDFTAGMPYWQEWEDGAAAANSLPEVAIGVACRSIRTTPAAPGLGCLGCTHLGHTDRTPVAHTLRPVYTIDRRTAADPQERVRYRLHIHTYIAHYFPTPKPPTAYSLCTLYRHWLRSPDWILGAHYG
jgi:hypothetical protein